ncbi:MAG: hypothetical protein QOE92_449 [Chloroflexota bacterium]|jgi:uncharacterized protein YndB with AHSA1/START domain|nr:hypothetical protein [Chloroflexota bacterium]
MVRFELQVDRPVDEVFDYMADFRNENEWNTVARDIVQVTDGPVGVGARFRGEYDRMGTMEYEIREYDTPGHLGVQGTAKMFSWYSTFDFKPSDGGTLVMATIDPKPRGVLKVVKPLMEGIMKSQMSKGMGGFKSSLEHRNEVAATA